ncbi:MAG: enoyl-CoA hydratase/isomerase family protein [Proteobacteria bacterium]|nr:enoyl-CoA hydratase/isomerase family protein [Pseudomonadota bacterium]
MTAPVFDTLQWAREGPVLTITLNRPQALNAMTAPMRRELCRALDLADADDAVRAIVFTGAGRAYCAGADLSAGATTFDPATQALHADETGGDCGRDGGGLLALRLFASTKPLIAAVNGAAVGVGASMLLPMDIRIASREARIGFVFTRRGIVPDACASWFLPRVVGIGRALEWSLSGRLLAADEALAGGLLRELCAPDELLPRARALALEIADNAAPVSVALTRQMMWRMLGAAHPMEAHRVESRAIAQRGATADAREGVAAFLEKRAPHFPGRVGADLPPVYPWWQEPDF